MINMETLSINNFQVDRKKKTLLLDLSEASQLHHKSHISVLAPLKTPTTRKYEQKVKCLSVEMPTLRTRDQNPVPISVERRI